MKQKPSYQPWNEEEFQADLYVRVMTPIQRWMYRALLQASFFHSTRPYLPNDDKILWILAGCESLEQWRANKNVILERFDSYSEDGSIIGNNRVIEDWGRLLEKREKMAELGRKSALVQRTFNARSSPVNGSGTSKSKSERESDRESEVREIPPLSLAQYADKVEA